MERLSVSERVAGFQAFFARRNPTPLVGFFLDSYYPLRRYRTEGFLPGGRIRAGEVPVEPFLQEYERLYRAYREMAGDFIWAGAAFWGLPWVEALAGCGVFVDHGTGSSRSLPPERPPEPEEIPGWDPAHPWAAKAVEFLDRLAAASGGRYPLATTLMRGVSDLLAALYGSPEFLFRLMDQPRRMERAAERIAELWLGFARAQLQVIPQFHGGTGSFYYSMWLPGKGVWLQEDAAALMSPELFARFVLPSIERIAACFQTTVIHLHPSTYIPVDHLAGSSVSAIELHIDLGGPSAEDLAPFYGAVLERKPLLIWGDLSPADLAFIRRALPPEGLALLPVVRSRQEAEAVWRQFKT